MQTAEKNQKLFEARSRNTLQVLEEALTAVLEEKRPLDLFLNTFFRSHPKYGSKDRRRIADAVFRVFRDYGFLQQLLKGSSFKGENLLLFSSVLAGEKSFPLCWNGFSPLELSILAEAADKGSFALRYSFLASFLSSSSGDGGGEFDPVINIPGELLPCFAPGAAEDMAQYLSKRSPVWFRMKLADHEKIRAEILADFASKDLQILFHAFKKDAFTLPEDSKRIALEDLASFKKGLFEVQDLSSQCIGSTLSALPLPDKATILDCCAGGGGKSLQIASAVREKRGKVFSWDIRDHALRQLSKRAARAGLENIRILDSYPEKQLFDAVLADVPCSGSGRWRRAPEQRLLLTEENLAALVKTQRQILEKAARNVKVSGILIYGTCSCFACENSENIRYFLENHPEFILESFPSPLTGELTGGMLSILPSSGNCDGAFVARLKKIRKSASS